MKTSSSRREFMRGAALISLGAAAWPSLVRGAETASSTRAMKLCLAGGSIGVKAGPRETLTLADKHGFDAIEPDAGFLSSLGEAELGAFLADMKAKGLGFGAAGLPVEFRGDEARFGAGMEGLPRFAKALQRAGVTRVGTWLMPCHNELTYLQNFRQHARRLREVCKALDDHGLRLGLEYVGTPTSRQRARYHFIHSLRETRELIEEIGPGAPGYVLDTWHWWTAGETDADLLSLKGADVISVDLNDAPAGIPLEQQQDGKRELPCATGVIPAATFLNALQRIGYDGPVRAEPFNKVLNDLDDEAACAAVIAALRKAMALVKQA